MQKIVVAIDGLHYKESVVEYAVSLTTHLNSHLVGLFLHDTTYHSYEIYNMAKGGILSNEEIEKEESKDVSSRKEALLTFEKACRLHRIQHTVRENKNIALPELVHESIYTDLLVINSGEKFTSYPENRPSAFIRALLETARCPVILVPDLVQPLKKAVLLYDGSPESVYAIKMFCTCLTGYRGLSTEVLSVNKPD
jgi:hypothetical protein